MYNIPLNNISVQDLVDLASAPRIRLQLSDAAKKNVAKGERAVETLLQNGKVVYGVNTGVGDLCDVVLPEKDIAELQKNIILSHACGSAPYVSEEVSRGALLLTINSLSKGFSGVTHQTTEMLVKLFNAGVSPLLPKRGSLGASGDLVPLSHLGLALLGKGSLYEHGKIKSASSALRRLGVRPVAFRPKEALGLINGTEVTSSQAAFVVHGAQHTLQSATAATALLFELFGASRGALDADLHALKPHEGQKVIAARLRALLAGSKICDRSGRRVQEAYVIRCAPQIDGAVFDAIEHARRVVETELNSVTDNPLFFEKGGKVKWVSGGNFHAQNVAFALDGLAIALAAFSHVCERRIERLLNSHLSGLPPFLAKKGGVHSGFMITQYLAAALVAENNVLAHPASIQSLPVSANQEDFVSMSMTAANKAADILDNTQSIVAILLLAATHAAELFAKQEGHIFAEFSPASRALHENIRAHVKPFTRDRLLAKDVEIVKERIKKGEI